MSEQKHELKVGIFVLIGLVLIGGLMIYFSKGKSLFKPTYTVFLKTANVGGLKSQAQVLLSGVPVGSVEIISLSDDGKEAKVQMEILSRFQIHGDASFTIDALGFLGDQYIAITPKEDKAPLLKEGDSVQAKEPFNMQELARAALGFVNRLDQTAKQLHETIQRVDRMVLNEQTLTNLARSVTNFTIITEKAIATVNGLQNIVDTNAPNMALAISNLVKFSDDLNVLAEELNGTVATNRQTVTRALDNVERTTIALRTIVDDVNAGKGLAGGLLRDEHLKQDIGMVVTNVNGVSSNLNVLFGNVNQHGLWSVLWKPKPAKDAEEKAEKKKPAGKSGGSKNGR